MDAVTLVTQAARIVLLFAGVLVPGEALMRAFRAPRTIATCFSGSVLSIYVSVLALQLTGVRISLVTLSGALAGIAIVASFVARRRRAGPAPGPTGENRFWFLRLGAWTPVFLLFWCAVLLRAWHEPLGGPDVEFRWSWLAEQMLRLGSLDFYPPRSAQDFMSYFWVESIPPGPAALHAWAYACGGSPAPLWVAPLTVLQLWTVHELLFRAADRYAGLLAAQLAVLAAAATPFLTWSVTMAQETGLTAIALAGIVFSLDAWQRTRHASFPALVGLFAAIGASAREYGVVFPLLAAVGLFAARTGRTGWVAFLPFAVISAIWPLRTALLSGNPFFSLPVAGLPVNERFVRWIEFDANAFGAVLQSLDGWAEIGRYLLLYAPAAVLGWIGLTAAASRAKLPAVFALVAVAAIAGLWASSVRYTNGGVFYSLRVLSPALAAGVLAAGVSLSFVAAGRDGAVRLATLGLGLLAIAALPATLALPQNPWRLTWREWTGFAHRKPPSGTDATVGIVLNALSATGSPGGGVVLADSPGYQRRFEGTGVRAIPLWSPQADALFAAGLPPAEVARRWRSSGVSHLIITKWQRNLDFFNEHSRWGRPPFQVQSVGETRHTVVFSIRVAE